MLTLEQQHALDELFAQVGEKTPPPPDFLQTWFGMSTTQLSQELQKWLQGKNEWERRFLDWAEATPLDAAFLFLGGAAAAFYQAEKGLNPKVKTYIDAFYYIATCASVGYADIFAVTQTGKAVAALVMIVGPAMAAQTLNRPSFS